jgi:sarcosine oxidase
MTAFVNLAYSCRMKESYDVVIVGGGVMGSSIAYFLASAPSFSGRILVLERDPTYEFCSTSRSWGGVRQQFTSAENIAMAHFNIAFFKSVHEHLAVDGETPDLGFKEQGYLFLGDAGNWAGLEAAHRLQIENGASVTLLTVPELAERFPWLNCEGLVGGSLGTENEGWIDPYAALMAFRRKARSLGAEYRHAEVAALNASGKRIDGVTLQDGSVINAGHVVNCAGYRAGALAATAGIALPVEPRKRMTYVFDCREDLSDMPLTIDVTGTATRPEGGQYLGILSPAEEDDPSRDDFELEYEGFESDIWPILAHRIPAFEAIKLTRAWAGHYDYNHFDHNAILGPHPEIAGIHFCNGFSGHGIQQSPAAGRAVTEWMLAGRPTSLDLSALGYQRILERRPFREGAVV